MLKGALAYGLALATLGGVRLARAQGEEDGLRRPERITIGVDDQFLGQLTPDERTLYFVSNRETRKQIYAQDLARGRARLAFDEGADVTWPRVAPDGRALLYISFRDQATGQLCVRALEETTPDAEERPEPGERRCLGSGSAALQAEWIDARRIVLIERTSIQGDFQISEVTVEGERLTKRRLLDRNVTSPAVSPDGRWLVFVPLDRVTSRIGPGFAARTAGRLEAVRLDGQHEPETLELDLPGMTGQPAFARDGRSLYFVQFFTDSNKDGVIDANDRGVLFRVPFRTARDDAPRVTRESAPLQLTDAGINCQYPAPAQTRLIATCTRAKNLDIYELPLTGEVPDTWTKDRLRTELDLATRPSLELLFYRHRLGQESRPRSRRLLTMRLAMRHLELEEFDAAEFYIKKVAALREPQTRGIGQPLLALVALRRSRGREERGQAISAPSIDVAAEMKRLEDGPKDSSAARVLNHVVRSELAESEGDFASARRELETLIIDNETPRIAIEAYFARADALFRRLEDRAALVAVCRRLAEREALDPDERLQYARATTRALTRGLPFAEADAILGQEQDSAPPGSELHFAAELARETLAIRSERPGRERRERLVALYGRETRLDRKRAIVLDAIQQASEVGADSLVEALAELYVVDVAPGTEERRRAERLYRRSLLGRAYRRLARGRLAEARADFEAVFARTASLEAAVALMDLRLGQADSPATIESELLRSAATQGSASASLAAFVKAYLLARRLPTLQGEAHQKAFDDAQALLRSAWPELKTEGAARALNGAILHEHFLQTGALASAERANSHYLVALELVRRDARYKAMVLERLGLLHVAVGNYHIALGYLEERAKMPYRDEAPGFGVRLGLARALLHVERAPESADEAERALAMVERTPALAPYRVLALDRAALYNLAANRFERALELYDLALPLLPSGDQAPARRNRFVLRLARAAAAIGAGKPERALADLGELDPLLNDPELVESLSPSHGSSQRTLHSYRSLSAGLRANANLALGRRSAATLDLTRRRAIFEERLATSEREEDARALTLVEARLASNAVARRDFSGAAHWLGLALEHADNLAARSGATIDLDQMRVLWLGAELHALGHAPPKLEIPRRLAQAHAQLGKERNRAYRAYKHWFEIYLTLYPAAP